MVALQPPRATRNATLHTARQRDRPEGLEAPDAFRRVRFTATPSAPPRGAYGRSRTGPMQPRPIWVTVPIRTAPRASRIGNRRSTPRAGARLPYEFAREFAILPHRSERPAGR